MEIFVYAIMFLLVILSLTIHEYGHGLAAYKLGDPTAYLEGRLTLNPFKHIDLVGTIIIPVILVWSTGFAFGWAKPVPINMRLLGKERTAIVAFAGPLANFIASALLIVLLQGQSATTTLGIVGLFLLKLNIMLGLFNLIPVLPLDGGRILNGMLSYETGAKLERTIGMFGFIGVFLLFAFTPFGGWLGAQINAFVHWV